MRPYLKVRRGKGGPKIGPEIVGTFSSAGEGTKDTGVMRKILTIEWRGSARRRCCRAAVSGKRKLLRRKRKKSWVRVWSSLRALSACAVIVHNARDECVWKALGAGCWAEHLAYQLKPLTLKVEPEGCLVLFFLQFSLSFQIVFRLFEYQKKPECDSVSVSHILYSASNDLINCTNQPCASAS